MRRRSVAAVADDVTTTSVYFWPGSAGCWRVLISPIPAVGGLALPIRNGRTLFETAEQW